ncbi:hypothetical protein HU200_053348 [Digitaria exilis]|uniref:F-box associated domain-containing protein n=1 Tax=Digitaria exilis TaxID=1010633 RepID=A0A835AK36_9POAL|nr:hypothetical protein HU200_053348 [Digitaria exilis]
MWQTAVTVKGFLFWHLDNKSYREQQQPPCGVLRLSLEDELFSVNGLPGTLDPARDDSFILDELHGELALTVGSTESPPYETVTIWVMSVEASKDYSEWERRYSIHVSDVCRPVFILPRRRIMLWKGYTLYRYDLSTSKLSVACKMDSMSYQGRRVRSWKNLSMFNLKPYTESLVRPTTG